MCVIYVQICAKGIQIYAKCVQIYARCVPIYAKCMPKKKCKLFQKLITVLIQSQKYPVIVAALTCDASRKQQGS